MNSLILPGRQVFLVDTHVNYDPSAAELAEITILAAEEMWRFGIAPKAALLSHSNFWLQLLPVGPEDARGAGLDPATSALARSGRRNARRHRPGRRLPQRELMPSSPLVGKPTCSLLPNIDAANISYNLLKTARRRGIAIAPCGSAPPSRAC